MPASWQARSPSAAYWLLELSPVAGPSFIFLTVILLRTFGFSFVSETPKSRAPPSFGFAPLATSFDGGTSLTCADGSPYDHWPFAHWLSMMCCAHWAIRAWYFTRSISSRIMAWRTTV